MLVMTRDRKINELVADLRRDFSREEFEELSARDAPFGQFELWLAEAIDHGLNDPNAMVVATATPDGL